jgi:hypothetical protein
MLNVHIKGDRVHLGDRFSVSFHRTLRIPDDGKTYPLPPGLGAFPIHRVQDFLDHLPHLWREHGGIFIPMYQREALWLGFDSAPWKPNAVKIFVGGINVLSGEPFTLELSDNIQDYMVCPPQLWLDGIKAGKEVIRQFVAMPLGEGSSVEMQLTGKEMYGGMQLMIFDPLPGKFPDHPPPVSNQESAQKVHRPNFSAVEMGVSAGGTMRQKVYPDPHGIHVWDLQNYGSVFVHLVNSAQYFNITGKKPPGTPIDVKTYAEKGLPWFDLYDEDKGDIIGGNSLTRIKSIQEKEAEKEGGRQGQENSVDVSDSSIHRM